jgi:hypothetical protein
MPANRPEFQDVEMWTRERVRRAVAANSSDALSRAVLAVALHDADSRYAIELCIQLATHRHPVVRGNALLGFGHIARVHRSLNRAVVYPLIVAGLTDSEAYVRGQAEAAKDDTVQFLEWKYEGA